MKYQKSQKNLKKQDTLGNSNSMTGLQIIEEAQKNDLNPVLLTTLVNHFTNAVILDVETTGLATGNEDLERNKELTNVSVIDAMTGANLYTTFVKPKHPISDQLSIVNIINNDIVKDAPDFSEIYNDIVKATRNKKIIGWNIQFDVNTIIEEAKKLNRDYLNDADIEGIEDGMELAMKASGLFKYTYNTAMFWKQDEACKLFDSYVYNANDIEKFAHNENHIDHIKDLENYIDTAFDEKYRKELHDQLGTKEMHLAYCDNKEYRLTMMKVTEMYRRGIVADKDKFIDSLMTSKKKNKYKSALKKETIVSKIIDSIKKGANIDDIRKGYAEEIGGNRSFDSILLANKTAFKDMENNPFDISPYAKQAIEKKFKELGNVFDVSKRTGYSILTVRNNIPHGNLTYSDKKDFERINRELPEETLDADNDKREDVSNGKINSADYDSKKKDMTNNYRSNVSNFAKNPETYKKEAKRNKIERQLGKNNKPLSSEIVENLSKDEQTVLETYLKEKSKENHLKQEYKAYESVLDEKLSLTDIDKKIVFQDDPSMKITYDPARKISKTFDRDAFEKECPDISHKYLMKEINDDNLEKLKEKYPDVYEDYSQILDDGNEFFDYDGLRTNEKDIYNEFATPYMSSTRKTFRFTPFGEEPNFDNIEKKPVDYNFIEEMHHIAVEMEVAKKEASELEGAVKSIIQAHDCMRIDGTLGRVSYSESTSRQKFNTTLLKEQEPDLYDYYCNVKVTDGTLKTSPNLKTVDKKAVSILKLIDDIKTVDRYSPIPQEIAMEK